MDLHWSDLDLDLTKDGFKDKLGRRERPALQLEAIKHVYRAPLYVAPLILC
jgi:hypothetical protein